MPAPPTNGNRGRAPTLYAIIAIKLLKGLTFFILAMVVYAHSDNDLPKEYHDLLHALRLNPERKFWTDLALKVDNLTEASMMHAAVGTLVYSLFAWVEGIGLMFRIPWAGWLSIGESAFFIPIEIYELNHNFTWLVLVILVLNIFMVWYLYQNRERLFHNRP
jgi:uncharacterized membrane protein (DUF2068 family)